MFLDVCPEKNRITVEQNQSGSTRALVRVLIQEQGSGSQQKGIRRAFLFERKSGQILETHTLFIDHEMMSDALNTQIAALRDLAFLYEWCSLKKIQNPLWIFPEQRASQSDTPLSEPEIRDLARWCQLKLKLLIKQQRNIQKKYTFQTTCEVVSPALRNRRLRYISHYLQWISINLALPGELQYIPDEKTELIRRFVERSFKKQIIAHSKPDEPRSLIPSDSKKLREIIVNKDIFPTTANGSRDKLIVELLLQGIRAGELLKTKVMDVNENFELQIGQRIGVINIHRRNNEIDDIRINEPAVKTRPGILPIPKRLIQEIITYVTQWRRYAVDNTLGPKETPYLFVSHSGPSIGQPISQRNLNRIVAKLKGQTGLPKSLTPHTLRHTHFTEVYQYAREKGRSDPQIQNMLILRGRWAPHSKMPAKYVIRALMKEAADFVEERDQALDTPKH